MIVFQHDNAAAASDRYELCGGGDAVADRGGQSDVGGVGIDQAGGSGAGALVLVPGSVSAEGLFDFLFGGLTKQRQAPPQLPELLLFSHRR